MTAPTLAPAGRPASPSAGVPAAPTPADLERWAAADEAARPARLAALRERLATEGIDAYFAVRRENIRYLTGFDLADGEEKVAGHSGQSFISGDEIVILADSRYRIQAHEEAPSARVEHTGYDLPDRWAGFVASLRPTGRRRKIRRIAAEAGVMPHGLWVALEEAAPDVELVAAGPWVEEAREIKEPAEIERIAAACRLGDAGLEALLPRIHVGVTERELAWELEAWLRMSGAEALAFDPAVLAGERAAMPHGSPTDRPIRSGEVLLFDFGAQVAGYRSDMTRTLFVGEPSARDRAIYDLVLRAQQASVDLLQASVRAGKPVTGRAADRAGRQLIEEAGYGPNFGHNTGHGIGLATHERPTLGRTGPETDLPSPTVFSVEPGVYLDGETGVRIEDLVVYDIDGGTLERLTRFQREVLVVPA
jgi:Xaa-Pro aminopeptidase